MKKTLAVIAVIAIATLAHADGVRTLGDTVPAADLERLVLDAGVGDIEVTAGSDDSVTFEVVLKPRRGGFFSSKKRAQREVEEARLEQQIVGRELILSIASDSEQRRFEEEWTIVVPARLAFELDLGVGDLEVRGITGEIEIEAGVGDLLVEGVSADVSVDLGVGDVTVTGASAGYGDVECSSGVGDARIRVDGREHEGDGFVGHTAEYRGDGPHSIHLEVGVGDSRVRLD